MNKITTVLILLVIFISLFFSGCSSEELKGDIYVFQGINANKEGNFLVAEDKFLKALETGVKTYSIEEIYTMLANTYIDLDKYEEAIENHKKALEIKPEFYQAWVGLGIAYRQSGNYEEARRCYQTALKINPDYAELHSSLGTLYILEDKPDEAIIELEKAINLQPNLAITYGNIALAYAMVNRFDDAEKALEKSNVLGYKNHADVRNRIEAIKNKSVE